MIDINPVGNFTKPLERPVVSCDTSPLITAYTGGCVLNDVTPVFVLDATKNINVRESAKHIYDAYYHPEWTKPEYTPKDIPGRTPNGKLHRPDDGAVPGQQDPDQAPSGAIAANRANSVAVCTNEWPTSMLRQTIWIATSSPSHPLRKDP